MARSPCAERAGGSICHGQEVDPICSVIQASRKLTPATQGAHARARQDARPRARCQARATHGSGRARGRASCPRHGREPVKSRSRAGPEPAESRPRAGPEPAESRTDGRFPAPAACTGHARSRSHPMQVRASWRPRISARRTAATAGGATRRRPGLDPSWHIHSPSPTVTRWALPGRGRSASITAHREQRSRAFPSLPAGPGSAPTTSSRGRAPLINAL